METITMEQLAIIIISSFLLSLCLIGMIQSVRYMIRNDKVYKFRRFVAAKSEEYEDRTGESGYSRFYYRLPSYAEMMMDKKPLVLESYFTEEEIRELLDLPLIHTK